MVREGPEGSAHAKWVEEFSPGEQSSAGENGPWSNGLAGPGGCQHSAGDHACGLERQADGLEPMGEATGSHCWLRASFPPSQGDLLSNSRAISQSIFSNL